MSDWHLVLATDTNGAVTNGSLSALRAAVWNAADVKVMYRLADGTWWSRQCISACVHGSGSETVISATCLEAINTNRDATGLVVAAPVELEQHIYNSTGWRSRATGGNIDAHRLRMEWYVRDYQMNWIINPDVINWINEVEG